MMSFLMCNEYLVPWSLEYLHFKCHLKGWPILNISTENWQKCDKNLCACYIKLTKLQNV